MRSPAPTPYAAMRCGPCAAAGAFIIPGLSCRTVRGTMRFQPQIFSFRCAGGGGTLRPAAPEHLRIALHRISFAFSLLPAGTPPEALPTTSGRSPTPGRRQQAPAPTAAQASSSTPAQPLCARADATLTASVVDMVAVALVMRRGFRVHPSRVPATGTLPQSHAERVRSCQCRAQTIAPRLFVNTMSAARM